MGFKKMHMAVLNSGLAPALIKKNNMSELVIESITKNYQKAPLLRNITLCIERGQKLCLLGPSGCGKTTLLRIIAGLEMPDTGDIVFRGKSVLHLRPHKKKFGMMFQDFALFPHRNVFQNIAFGLEMQKKSKGEIKNRVSRMLELVNLENYGNRNISELSGGERQRVALARTLAPAPDLIMLDEPLGSLDRLLRERLLADLCFILKETRITTIFVTHDQAEAFAAADLVCVMDKGTVEQVDSPERLYNHPANKRVADFLGFQNFLQGSFKESNCFVDSETGITFYCCRVPRDLNRESHLFSAGLNTTGYGNINKDVLLMPNSASIISQHDFFNIKKNKIAGTLEKCFFQGSLTRISVRNENDRLLYFDMPNQIKLPFEGEKIFIYVDPEGVRQIG